MNVQLTPRQRRSQRGSVEDRWRKRVKDDDGSTLEVPAAVAGKVTRWRIRYVDDGGREIQRSFGRKVDAQHWLDAQLASLLRGEHVSPEDAKLTVGQWCDTWLDGYRGNRESTVRQAKTHLKRIMVAFGTMPLGSVRPSHVRTWCAQLSAEGLEDSYVYALRSRLAQVFADAVHDGLVAKSPCSRRTSPSAGKQRTYVCTTEQMWALHDALPERLRAAVLLGGFAGLRDAEVCGLRVTDVDFMRGIINPAAQHPAQPLKTDASRAALPIPQSLALALSAHVAQWSAEGFVFVNEWGDQLAPWTLQRAIRTAREKVPGLPPGFRFHDLRHYLASMLIASGADVKVVQARLRHASAKTTLDTYAHLWPDSDESTRTAIDAVMQARAAAKESDSAAE